MRMEAGTIKLDPSLLRLSMQPVAYRRSMKTVSQSMPKKQDLPALAEFANLTITATSTAKSCGLTRRD